MITESLTPSRPRSSDRSLDKMLKAAWKADGWKMRRTGTGHTYVIAPNGHAFSVPDTPSKQRTIARFRSHFRKGGLEI